MAISRSSVLTVGSARSLHYAKKVGWRGSNGSLPRSGVGYLMNGGKTTVPWWNCGAHVMQTAMARTLTDQHSYGKR